MEHCWLNCFCYFESNITAKLKTKKLLAPTILYNMQVYRSRCLKQMKKTILNNSLNALDYTV